MTEIKIEPKNKYRTIEVSGKKMISTDWKKTFLVEDDFNEKDMDWDKFLDTKPVSFPPNPGDVPKTYWYEITGVVEGEEYSETSSHTFDTSPHKLIRDGKTFHTQNIRDDKGTWTKKIKGFFFSTQTELDM